MRSNHDFVDAHNDACLRASKRLLGFVRMGQHSFANHDPIDDDLPSVGVSVPSDVIRSDGYGERQGPVTVRRRGDRHHISTLLDRGSVRTAAPADQCKNEHPPTPGSAYR